MALPTSFRQQPDGRLPIPGRLLLALPMAFFSYANYNLVGRPIRPPLHPQATWIDQAVPFIPETFWVYILGYFFCFVLMFFAIEQGKAFRSALAALIGIQLLALPFFIWMPVASPRPVLEGALQGQLALVHQLYQLDTAYNTFPSLHVACSALAAGMSLKNNRLLGGIQVLLCLGICISVLTLKQHWFVDIPGGLLLAAGGMAFYGVGLRIPRMERLPRELLLQRLEPIRRRLDRWDIL